MKIEMKDFQPALADIAEMILAMPAALEQDQEKAFKDIGQAIKKHVQNEMPRGAEDGINYDGSTPYKHMADDVKVTLQGKKTGEYAVVVHGGKKTAYKWHMLDSGTRNPDGTQHTPATHFTSIALAKSQQDIDEVLMILKGR